ncbi:MAG: hypothetical protein ACRDPQ_05345 [Nocardioidaceae bacterium]
MDGWLAHKGNGGPGFMQSYEDGREVTTYLPRGDVDEGVELLVLVREFHGAADTILELDQQFRMLPGVNATHRGWIEAVQPYNGVAISARSSGRDVLVRPLP